MLFIPFEKHLQKTTCGIWANAWPLIYMYIHVYIFTSTSILRCGTGGIKQQYQEIFYYECFSNCMNLTCCLVTLIYFGDVVMPYISTMPRFNLQRWNLQNQEALSHTLMHVHMYACAFMGM